MLLLSFFFLLVCNSSLLDRSRIPVSGIYRPLISIPLICAASSSSSMKHFMEDQDFLCVCMCVCVDMYGCLCTAAPFC